ncbi:HAMP domain-containing sensor histidine kinase [Enterococcus ratti]|uniref:sensor histidine kinase n=1 Tax=Enterococcus ratti TaxID=150033 RepID=UPI0035175341
MNRNILQKQRKNFFVANVLAFALVFFLLRLITLQVLSQSAYWETDLFLKNTDVHSQIVQLEIARYQQNNPFLDSSINESITDQFNTQIVLWSSDGKILNKEEIGGRFSQIEEVVLDKQHLNTIQTIELKQEESDSLLSFRSITKKAGTNQGNVAYIQILANTNQIKHSFADFRRIMILCMVIFWVLSIGISYYLSNLAMRPILASWKRQKEFIENASHELRTPLTIIQNSLEYLFTKPNHRIIEESESIAQALSQTRRLSGLTRDLLTIARNDSNEQTLEIKAIQTNEFLDELVKPFQEMAAIDHKEFILQNETQVIVHFDPQKLHQVFVILLDNALKYTNQQDRIVVISKANHKDWLIHIKNTGPTISDEAKKHIFDRFYREDRSRSKETGGYGLGLAIAKQIVVQHKGQIMVADNFPQGADFKIQLPLK